MTREVVGGIQCVTGNGCLRRKLLKSYHSDSQIKSGPWRRETPNTESPNRLPGSCRHGVSIRRNASSKPRGVKFGHFKFSKREGAQKFFKSSLWPDKSCPQSAAWTGIS